MFFFSEFEKKSTSLSFLFILMFSMHSLSAERNKNGVYVYQMVIFCHNQYGVTIVLLKRVSRCILTIAKIWYIIC